MQFIYLDAQASASSNTCAWYYDQQGNVWTYTCVTCVMHCKIHKQVQKTAHVCDLMMHNAICVMQCIKMHWQMHHPMHWDKQVIASSQTYVWCNTWRQMQCLTHVMWCATYCVWCNAHVDTANTHIQQIHHIKGKHIIYKGKYIIYEGKHIILHSTF